MKKLNLKKLSALVFLLIAIIVYNSDVSYAGDNKGRIITGKVVYSDDNSPVSGGSIKVVRITGSKGMETVIENAVINAGGQFKLLNIVPGNTDDIKIMCYPNDYEDNIQFEPKAIDLNSALANAVNENMIVIKVERPGNKTSKELK